MLVENPIPGLFPLCCYNKLHSSGKLSTRFWSVAVGICVHSATRALVRSGADVGEEVWGSVGVPVHPKGVQWG